jgi:beta-lactamase regulating signal transducer with metallopeptidase domain
VRLDAPNRLFLTLALGGLLLSAYAMCGVVEGILAPLVITSVSRNGWAVLLSVRVMAALILLGLVGVALAQAGRVLTRQVAASRHLKQRTGELAIDPPIRLVEASRAAGLSGRLILIRLSTPVSFVYGVVRPRVVISDGLLERLSSPELLAVLEHERYHVSNLDPLKTAMLRLMTAALAFVPDLEPFRVQYRAGRELAADRRAIATCGRRPLAGALLKAMPEPDWADTDAAVPLQSHSLLHRRVTQLESGAAPPDASFASVRALLTVLSANAWLAIVATAIGCTSSVTASSIARLGQATLIRGLLCAAPIVAVGLLAYALLALKINRSSTRSGPGYSCLPFGR